MYDHLWHAMMAAPIPPSNEPMNDATNQLYAREYREELARHIRPLIRSAIRYWEMTLLMVERTGAQTEWAERARTDLERMRGLLLEQNRQEDGSATGEERRDRTSALELPASLSEDGSEVGSRALLSARSGSSSRARASIELAQAQ
jgi:hypothetical protein